MYQNDGVISCCNRTCYNSNFKYHIQFINTALMRYERFFGTVFCSLSDPAHASARVCIA